MKTQTKDLVRLDGSYGEPIECNYIIAIMWVGFGLKTKAFDGLRAEARRPDWFAKPGVPSGLVGTNPTLDATYRFFSFKLTP